MSQYCSYDLKSDLRVDIISFPVILIPRLHIRAAFLDLGFLVSEDNDFILCRRIRWSVPGELGDFLVWLSKVSYQQGDPRDQFAVASCTIT